MSTLSVRLTRN